MTFGANKAGMWGALVAAAALAVPAIALAAGEPKKAPAVAVSIDRLTAYTPADADPRLAAHFAGRTSSITDFSFTPAASKSRPSQIRVAVRSRSTTSAVATTPAAASAPSLALNPTSYNLGAAVGWKRFAAGGDIGKVANADPAIGDRKSAVVGLSYNLKKVSGRVTVGAERGNGRIAALAQPDRYSVDVGGAIDVSRRFAVTGGVRYRIDEDRAKAATTDNRRDSQAVYVGTAIKF